MKPFRGIPPISRRLPWILFIPLALAIALLVTSRKQPTPLLRPLPACTSLLLLAIAFGAVSCGGGGSSGGTSGGGTTEAPATLTLSCNLPAGAMAGVSYSATCIAGGGTAPFTYSISSGALPAGLSINSSKGAVTGVPTALGISSFTVKVTDSGSAEQAAVLAESSLTLAPPTLTLSCTLPTATAGVAYSSGCTSVGGTAPLAYSISAGALPAGLSLSSAGVISGTPTNTATSSFTVMVTDSSSPTQSASQAIINFVVSSAALTLNCTLATVAQVGVTYTGGCNAIGDEPHLPIRLVPTRFPRA